mmetsp:Transcript_178621/g.572587  ORF Transcript_178621/g.572587 Transcript_178621/m.572587 type:complete len:1077 (-) Transcript_178621:21-3251(-)|eukprot:CAMPEP_0203842308 /NCGR_PEP_ID=MMETSP0359-20131031/1912_1 /ASSEMBLY_ACC=CAM_ASM_000338 /TAXON_ID=268821 /ORGANISM="Scrippsiella Hangoei, Strain SHTV-5" /LENGTH=1076 /DNA_ID=CAMNT_0050756871 /DNA_START=111 /DNA_END=3341 /DNA_ORIENTATION=+
MASWLGSLNKRAAKTGLRAVNALGGGLLSAPSGEHGQILSAVDHALSVHIIHSNVSKAVDRCMDMFPGETDEDGQKCLRDHQVLELSVLLAKELNLPPDMFAGLEDELDHFDVDGNALFDASELKRLFKKVLQSKRMQLGGRRKPVKVPNRSMQDAGYTVLKELGRGGQGAMYLATKTVWFRTKKYCIKFYSKGDENAGGLEELLDEYELMIDLDNPYIAKTFEVFQDPQFYYLVNEPYFGGDLTKLGQKAHEQGVRMSEAWWRPIFRQCLDGLSYLHSRGIMHCDIKEPNIMIASGDSYASPTPVLIDFGLSASFMAGGRGVCGTPGYIPPETWQTGCWFPRGDTFSLGVTFFQLLTGRVPSKNGTVFGVLQPKNGDYDGAAHSMPLPWDAFPASMPGLRQLLEAMTDRERMRRPKPHQVLKDPWFDSRSDAELPQASLRGLLGVAAAHDAHEELHQQLTAANKLADLHTMVDKFQRQDPSRRGTVDARVAASVLAEHGADATLVQKTMAAAQSRAGGAKTFNYAALAAEVIATKQQFDQKFARDLFDRLDADKSGTLSLNELEGLLCSKAFDVAPEHVGEILAWMDTNGDGIVSFQEFSRATLEYGRLANRSEVDENSLPVGGAASGGIASLFAWGGGGVEGGGGGGGGGGRGAASRTARAGGDVRGWPASLPPSAAFGPAFGGGSVAPRGGSRRAGGASMAPQTQRRGGGAAARSAPASSFPSREEAWQQQQGAAAASFPSVVPSREEAWQGPRHPIRLLVSVLGARGLRDAEPFADCNPFVTCGASGGQLAAFQTQVVHNSGEPCWNFEQELPDFVLGDNIDFAVLCAGPAVPGRTLAGLAVGCEDNLIGTASAACERFYPHGFAGELTVMGPGTGIRGLLRVRIMPIEDFSPTAEWGPEPQPLGSWSGAASRHEMAWEGGGWAPPMDTPQMSPRREMQVTWGRSWTEIRAPVVVGRSTSSNAVPAGMHGSAPVATAAYSSYMAGPPQVYGGVAYAPHAPYEPVAAPAVVSSAFPAYPNYLAGPGVLQAVSAPTSAYTLPVQPSAWHAGVVQGGYGAAPYVANYHSNVMVAG